MDTLIEVGDGARAMRTRSGPRAVISRVQGGVEHATSLDVEKNLNAETPRRGDTQS
jgi:hypothetical protein